MDRVHWKVCYQQLHFDVCIAFNSLAWVLLYSAAPEEVDTDPDSDAVPGKLAYKVCKPLNLSSSNVN